MMRMRGIWALLLTLAFAQVAGAQQVMTFQTDRGWIGISFNYDSAVLPDGSEATVVVIEAVVDESPAEAAGIQRGDTVTHLDGQPISEEVMTALTRTLKIGDLVRMTILRGGRSREVLVEAGPQTTGGYWIMTPDADEMVVRLDSVRGAILSNLDSLRLTISGVEVLKGDSMGAVSIRVVRPDARPGDRNDFFDLTYRFREPPVPDSLHKVGFFLGDSALHRSDYVLSQLEPPVPFGAYVVATKETEPIREELRRLRKELTDVRRQELSRIRELQAGVQGPVEELLRNDEKIQQLKAEEQSLLEEQVLATSRLRRVSEQTMQRQFSELQMRQEEALASTLRSLERSTTRGRAEAEESYRQRERALLWEEYQNQAPTRHITVGQNFVAGAQLTPLNPALAEYFRVDRGVLVTEVLDGTPAHEAGMLAGDVIVRVGTQDVTSLSDLRFGVGYFERPLRLRVIRKGSPVDIVIG